MAKSAEYPTLFDTYTASIFSKAAQTGPLYQRYKTGELSGSVRIQLDGVKAALMQTGKKRNLPGMIALFSFFAILFIGSILLGVVTDEGIGFQTAYQNAAFLFWLMPALLVPLSVSLVFFLKAHKRFKMHVLHIAQNEGKDLDRKIAEYFNFPADKVDILLFRYVISSKNNKPLASRTALMSVTAYAEGEFVCFYHDNNLLKVPKRACLTAQTMNRKIMFQDAALLNYKAPECKQFGIKKTGNNNDMTVARCFGRLLFQSEGGTWALDILPTHFDHIKKLFSKE